MTITNCIEQRRRELGLSQTVLAEKVGITQSAISMIESGARAPSLLVITKIATVLGCTVDDLLGTVE